MSDATFHGTRQELYQKAVELKDILTGAKPDTYGIARGFLFAIAMGAMADIKEAFLIKAKGGTDAMGITWPPLAEYTISRRRVTKEDEKSDPAIKVRMKIVRREYKKLYPEFKLYLSDADAQRRARKVAEIRATKITGKTKVQTLGHRVVEILRDTGRLLNSISPGLYSIDGVNVSYSPPTGDGGDQQILEYQDGRVVVGTNVEYAIYHDSPEPRKLKADGTPRLPRRQIFPENEEQVPTIWWENWFDLASQALVQAAVLHFSK